MMLTLSVSVPTLRVPFEIDNTIGIKKNVLMKILIRNFGFLSLILLSHDKFVVTGGGNQLCS